MFLFDLMRHKNTKSFKNKKYFKNYFAKPFGYP